MMKLRVNPHRFELVHLLRNLPQDKKHRFDLKTLPL
jgi:hypothetical protein